jgi:hypothetical protein
MTAIEVAARRRSLGTLSILTALGTLALVTALFVAGNQIPKTSWWYNGTIRVSVIPLWAGMMLGHLVGLVLGIAALFRGGDRRLLGLGGVLLNGVVVALGLLLFYMAALGLLET